MGAGAPPPLMRKKIKKMFTCFGYVEKNRDGVLRKVKYNN